MDITSISIRNCLTIGHADIELDNRGLLLVQGENTDDTSTKSNGAGKSSLLDALCWCLYGETARGVSGDDIVNETAKKDCSVIVTLNDGGTLYKIERFRKHSKYKNQLFAWQLDHGLTGSSTDLSKGTDKETQIVVEKIMGCSLDVFVGAIYAGQEKMPDLPGMTDKALKLIVEEAAGVEELADAYTEARQRALKVDGEAKVAEANMKSSADAWDRANADLKQLEAEHGAFETGRKDRAKAELAKIKPMEEGITEARTKLASYDKPTLEERKGELDAALAGRRAEEAELAKLQAAVTAADRKVTQLRTQAGGEKKRMEAQQQELTDIDNQIGKPCGECGKNYCEHDLDAAREARRKKIETTKADLTAIAKEFRDATTALSFANAKVSDFQSKMTDVSAASAELSGINANLGTIATLERAIAQLEKDINAVKVVAKAKLTEANPYSHSVKNKKEMIERIEKEMHLAQDAVTTTAAQAELYNDAVKVFGPAGVRAHILDTVTPFLNEKTSEYLGALADGNIHAQWSTLAKTAKGDLKEKFNIDVTNDKGGKTFKALSGGEKRKVRISAAMALQDMVASRATKPINLFMADEIDHALDEPGLERLMTVLDRKAKERGTVLVVSHNSLSDWIDSVITVTKAGGISTVSGATHRGF
jgi:DNA repair exonuclease SbcCD ATPase subunit